MHHKVPLLEKAIKASNVSTGPGVPANLMLDNFKALSSREADERDLSSSECCFAQAFRQLAGKDPVIYKHIFSDGRIFQIQFVEEAGIDAGGVFREGMTRIVEDLFSEHFDLLILCPNGQHDVHANMDKYLPNPRHTGPLALQMFEFVGNLMASSLRTKLHIPFEFPSLVWKKIVGDVATSDDLLAFDALTYRLLDSIRQSSEHEFDEKFKGSLTFMYTRSDGEESELMPGGSKRVVTFANRLEYCDAVLHARLCEFDPQIRAMERGFFNVAPSTVLQLFSWDQVELLTCGSPIFDIELWKSKTEVSGVSAKTVSLFWEVMESLSFREQSAFVRFAWGRSRLPAAKDFHKTMRLVNGNGLKLPVSHTCFFSIELPNYDTIEKMRHGLLTVINYGAGGILNG
jgi:hypothetical protein